MSVTKTRPTIAYVMGFMGVAGGNRIIYEHANRLADKGIGVYLLHLNDGKDRGWFEINPKVKIMPFQDVEKWIHKIDIIIATFNETFWNIIDLPSHIHKAYFVQTDERRFYERGSLGAYLSNATYTFKNVAYYTEARWMQEWLKNEFNIQAPSFQNKINPEHFFPEKSEDLRSDKTIVLVEGNAHTPKKGVQDAAEALKDIDCEKWLLTNSQEPMPEFTRIFDRIFSLPTQKRIRQIYSSADILVKPSYFEGSPLPHMEAMACGTALISTNCTGVDEYCKHLKNAFIVEIGNIKQIKDAIELLIKDKDLRQTLRENGLKFARETLYDWDSVIEQEVRFFSGLSFTRSVEPYTLETLTRKNLENSYFAKQRALNKRITRKLRLVLLPLKLIKRLIRK